MTERVSIELFGPFRVCTGEETVDWPARRAAELVQLLALADCQTLPRERAIEALWPHLDAEAGAANLRKAAHNVRKALADPEALELRGGQVTLYPDRPVRIDVADFREESERALAAGDPAACEAVAAAYAEDLLPNAPYEEWAQQPREQLRELRLQLLRRAGDWEAVAALEPADEEACRELMRTELERGSRPAAIRTYGRLRTALRRELGVGPSPETAALYADCTRGLTGEQPELVGRELELGRVDDLLRTAGQNEVTLIAVRGPAGIGKSALCRELERLGGEYGIAAVHVVAFPDTRAYGPLNLLAEKLLARDPGLRERLGERTVGVLKRMAGTNPGPDTAREPPALTRQWVIGAVQRLLAAAGEGPALLVVDDAHLADEATLDVLQHLGSGATPILVAVAYRDEAPAPLLAAIVQRLDRAGRAYVLDLEPLEPPELRALISAEAPASRSSDVVDRIVDLAQGNPFLAIELSRSPVAGVPALVASARDAITGRFLDLDPRQTLILRRLALAGGDLDPATVVALSGAAEDEAFALLDAALAAGALIVADGRYRFRHDILREVLVEELAPHEQIAIHRELAERLEDATAPAAAIARHWLDGSRPERARPWLLEAAGEAMALGAYRDAITELDLLLEHEPEHPEALRMRAESLDAIGEPEALPAYAAAAAATGEPGADDLRAKRALAQVKLGDPTGGLAALEGLAPQSRDGKLAQALAYAGSAALGYGDPGMGTEKAGAARRAAIREGDAEAAVIASWAHAAAAHARGELRESVTADLYDTQMLPQLAVSVFDGQLCITQRLLYGARPYPDVIEFADAFAAEAERLGAARGRAFAVTMRGEALLLAGELAGAEKDLRASADLHHALGAATGESFALQRRSEAALQMGDRDEAVALLDESLTIAREADCGFHLFDRIYGARIALAPDPTAALAALEEAELAVRGPDETCPGCRITLAFPAAVAAARAGDMDRLARWEREMEFLANVVMRLPAWDAALEEVRAHSARARGDERDARLLFADAATGYAGAGQPLDERRCATEAAGAGG